MQFKFLSQAPPYLSGASLVSFCQFARILCHFVWLFVCLTWAGHYQRTSHSWTIERQMRYLFGVNAYTTTFCQYKSVYEYQQIDLVTKCDKYGGASVFNETCRLTQY